MGVPLFQVDAFTEKPFAGNPAGVCLLTAPAQAAWMQAVAAEMNLAETAFLEPRAGGYHLRWFTPTVEVDLCGHATLASAHVLWEQGHLPAQQQARFFTRSGWLTARRLDPWIELDFPAAPPAPSAAPAGLAQALGAEPVYVGRTSFFILALLDSEQQVRALRPDLAMLKKLDASAVIVTAAASTPGFDFVSRMFAPKMGIDEDPVTGAAHCCLGPFWGARLGKGDLVAYQASARGGVVRVSLHGERVLLQGRAVTVIKGELLAQG